MWSWNSGANAILKMAHAIPLQKQDDPQLFNVVDEMRIAAGIPMPKIYLIGDSAMNAFATGRDPAHGVVAITKGLREKLNRDELQSVIAHEIAHIRHYDIRFAMLGLPTPDTLAWQQGLARLSPGTLYGEAVVAMLNPDAQSMTTLLAQFQGRIGSPLPLDQSILQAWPQIVSLIAGMILLYVISYVAFQRQEVRA